MRKGGVTVSEGGLEYAVLQGFDQVIGLDQVGNGFVQVNGLDQVDKGQVPKSVVELYELEYTVLILQGFVCILFVPP